MAKGTILTTRRGGGGSSKISVYGEFAVGAKDNSNKVFRTTGDYVTGSLCVYYNGQRLSGNDYTENGGDEFELIYVKPYDVDKLMVDYVLQNL